MFVQQCKFIDHNDENAQPIGGMLIDSTFIICGECGGVIEIDEEIEIVEIYDYWVDLSATIIGD